MSFTCLIFSFYILSAFLTYTSNSQCLGCADSSNCFAFDAAGDFLGCYGTFSGGITDLSSLCAGDFVAPNVSFASSLGFTSTMCTSVADDEIFFFAESGVGAICNSELGLSSNVDMWGCSGSQIAATNTFDGTCSVSDQGADACLGVTEFNCGGSDFVVGGTTVIDIGTSGNEGQTLALLDATYGGTICARAQSPAPTNMPTIMPSMPTLAPTDAGNHLQFGIALGVAILGACALLA